MRTKIKFRYILVNMAEDAFGDSLFDEFDREDAPTDSILRSKINKELQPRTSNSNATLTQESTDCKDGKNGAEIPLDDNTSSGEEIMDSETETDHIPRSSKSPSSVNSVELSQLQKENILYL